MKSPLIPRRSGAKPKIKLSGSVVSHPYNSGEGVKKKTRR